MESRLEWRTVKGSIIEAPALPANIILVWKGLTVTSHDKYSSYLRYEIKYDCKKFYSTGPWLAINKTAYERLTIIGVSYHNCCNVLLSIPFVVKVPPPPPRCEWGGSFTH